MTTMVVEICDALTATGSPDDKARKASETIAKVDTRMMAPGGRMDRTMDRITLMLGVNLTATLMTLSKMLLPLR